jgi:mannose-6-phosphate isomerase
MSEFWDPECLMFRPLYMERVWGGKKMSTLFRRQIPTDNPIGESWELVDRADAQSIVSEGRFSGLSLNELWKNRRSEIFGAGYDYERFPLLIKIIDASDALSVQVHPPAGAATGVFDEPKTEFWYFVATDEGAGVYVGLKSGTCKEDFQSALINGTVERLLHRISTRADSFMFLPGGRLHAIDGGNVLFEVQQNSDTTYRVFDWNRVGLDGKPRQLHIEQSLHCIDFTDIEPALSECNSERLVAEKYFIVDRWVLDQPRPANIKPLFSIFQVVQGVVLFDNRLEFRYGDLFMVPAYCHGALVGPKNERAIVLRTTL